MINRNLNLGSILMTLGSLLLIPFGAVYYWNFFSGEDLEYGIDTEYVDVTKAEINEFSHSLLHFMEHTAIDVSVLMISLGLAIAALSWFGVREKMKWAYWVAVASFLFTMIPGIYIHYPRGLASTSHLLPVYFNSILFVIGAIIAYPALKK